MKLDITLLSEAEIDIDNAYIWYEKRQIGLGDKFFDIVNSSILTIQKNPLIYVEVYEGIRRCVIRKFPYGIYYKINADSNELQIIGVIHFSRNPNIINKRL